MLSSSKVLYESKCIFKIAMIWECVPKYIWTQKQFCKFKVHFKYFYATSKIVLLCWLIISWRTCRIMDRDWVCDILDSSMRLKQQLVDGVYEFVSKVMDQASYIQDGGIRCPS